MEKITKSHNHSHFWVNNGVLYESYNTIRGLRYRAIREVAIKDTDLLTNEQLKELNNGKEI